MPFEFHAYLRCWVVSTKLNLFRFQIRSSFFPANRKLAWPSTTRPDTARPSKWFSFCAITCTVVPLQKRNWWFWPDSLMVEKGWHKTDISLDFLSLTAQHIHTIQIKWRFFPLRNSQMFTTLQRACTLDKNPIVLAIVRTTTDLSDFLNLNCLMNLLMRSSETWLLENKVYIEFFIFIVRTYIFSWT